MTPVTVTKQLAASSANNIALSQTPVSGTALTLNGSTVSGGVATLDTQRRVLLTYGNEGSARTLVLTGFNGQGTAITETLAIPSGASGTVASKQDFLKITKALPAGGGWTAAVTLGTNAVGSTAWQIPNFHSTTFQIGFQVELTTPASGDTATIEATRDTANSPISIYTAGMNPSPPICDPFSLALLTNLTADGQAALDDPFTAWRLTITAGTGLWTARSVQSGFRG